MPASQLAAKGRREVQLMRAVKRYVSRHTNADPVGVAAQKKYHLAADYLRQNGYISQV